MKVRKIQWIKKCTLITIDDTNSRWLPAEAVTWGIL